MNTAASVPIATSTPVNLAAGPLSPPPLTLAAGQGPHHEHPPGTAPTVKVTSYPAVLKGRSAASPPNPNLVPSGKVPPPVPPRGTGASRTGRSSEDHRAAGTAASTTSSATSSRGDEAAIITRYRLHDSSCDLHHSLLPDHFSISTSITTAKTVASTITAATSTKATSATSNTLHARTSTPDTYRVTREAGRVQPMDSVLNWRVQKLDEDKEEFVSVEKIKDAYFIKISLHPLRPDRGIRRFERPKNSSGITETDSCKMSREDKERRNDTKADHLAKFTYFLNPASRADLMNYKMSRKDKKHSETYYEMVKRKQKDLETSIMTITTMSNRCKPVDDAGMYHTDTSHAEKKCAEQKMLKFASIKKDSTSLQKIRENSRRKKRLASKPSKKRTSVEGTFNRNVSENEKRNTKREDEKLSLKINSLENKSDSYQIEEKNSKNDIDFTSKERKQSAIGCDKTKQNSSSNRDHHDKKKNISKNINDEQENDRRGFKEIFPNSCVENKHKEDKTKVRKRIGKFDRQTNERLNRYKPSEGDYKNCDESSSFREKEFLFDDNRKNILKDPNRNKLLSITKREEFISSSFDDIRNRNSDVVKSSISKKTFEKIKASEKDETKDARRKDIHLDNSNCGNKISAIKPKFTLSVNEIRLNQEEEVLKAGLLNISTGYERQKFKSFSSSHCDDLPFNPEFGMLKPNVSFLHTYRKTRSFT